MSATVRRVFLAMPRRPKGHAGNASAALAWTRLIARELLAEGAQ